VYRHVPLYGTCSGVTDLPSGSSTVPSGGGGGGGGVDFSLAHDFLSVDKTQLNVTRCRTRAPRRTSSVSRGDLIIAASAIATLSRVQIHFPEKLIMTR